MLYYYADAAGQACGPVAATALHAALHDGTLTPETLAVEDGGTEWKPLAALLRYYYADGGEVLGPVRLAELPVFAAAAGGGEFMVLPEGGAEWVPFGVMNPTPAAAPGAHVPAYVPPLMPRPPARPPPSAARAAGVIWITFGIAKLCETFIGLFSVHRLPAKVLGIILLILGLNGLIALLFLHAGIKTARGKASDFGGFMHLSCIFGLLGIVYTAAVVLADPRPLNGDFLMMMGFPVLLFTAGLLAMSSRQAYRDWKAGKPAAARTKRTRRKQSPAHRSP